MPDKTQSWLSGSCATVLAYGMAALSLTGCNPAWLDAENKKCKIILHRDFKATQPHVKPPLIFANTGKGKQKSGLKIYYQNELTRETLELRPLDRDYNGRVGLDEIQSFRHTQINPETGTQIVSLFDQNKCDRYVCDPMGDILYKTTHIGGKDGRNGDVLRRFLTSKRRYDARLPF